MHVCTSKSAEQVLLFFRRNVIETLVYDLFLINKKKSLALWRCRYMEFSLVLPIIIHRNQNTFSSGGEQQHHSMIHMHTRVSPD